MKYLFTTYKRRMSVAITCLLLLFPLNLALHGAYTAWPQFATKYSYLEDARYREQPRVSITANGYAVPQCWSENYVSTWTYFFASELEFRQSLRSVQLPDGATAEINLNDEELSGIQSFIADGITEFGIRTSWTRVDGSWYANNTDLVTGESIDFFTRKYTTRGTLQPEHLQNIQSMLEKSGAEQFILHNDVVLPDGLRREVYINREDVSQALADIEAGKINGLQVETSWNVEHQAIWMRQLSEVDRSEHLITNLMQLTGQDNYQDFMYSILDRIVDLQILGNLTLIMTVFIIGLTIGVQEKKRKTA